MSQQINLLNPALIKKTDFLNPNNIVLLFGVLLLAILAYYLYANNVLTKLTVARAQVAESLAATQAQLTQIQTTKTASTGNQTLLNTIKQLEQKEIMQQAIVKAVSQNSATPSHSYAALLRAFSKQSVDGLWITGLSIDQDAEALSISGRTLNADLLPKFIARLRAEPALKGKSFTDLTMQSSTKINGATPEPAVNTSDVTPADTTQISTLSNDSTKVSINQVSTNQAGQLSVAPQFIEFTLRSTTESKTAGNQMNSTATESMQNNPAAGGSH